MDANHPASFAPTTVVIALTLVAVITVLLQRLLRVDHDPCEPPLVPSKIPLFGHAIGLYRYGKQYYQMIEEKYHHDIYTLALPGTKQYVITSPALTAAVSRQSKLISFRPFIVSFGRKLMLFDDTAHAINEKNLFDEDAQGVITASHDVFYNNLPSGPILDAICRDLLSAAARDLNALPTTGGTTTGLATFCKTIIGFPTMRALWGPDNIMARDPTLLPSFWAMEEGQVALGLGVLPALTARAAHRARARLQDAMAAYFADGGWRRASALVRRRAEAHFRHGYSTRMFAHSETGLLVGALPNSTFTIFWLLARVFADAALLADVRAELVASGAVAVAPVGGEGEGVDEEKKRKNKNSRAATVSVARLRARCPLLSSAFRETLRLAMPTSSVRAVRADVVLADRHLLRAGATVLIDAGVMHTKPSIWGADAASFNPRRFLDAPNGEITLPSTSAPASAGLGDGGGGGGAGVNGGGGPGGGAARKVHPAAFRGFGGGEVFCPGRNLAQVEITGIVAALVCGWDVEAAGAEGGPVSVPPPLDDVMPIGVWKPRWDVDVRMGRREGWEDVEWGFVV